MLGPETKRRIIDLSLNKHKTIREIAKISKKSSRDITATLKEQKGKSSTQAYEVDKLNQGLNSIEEPLNAKAYRLFAQGKNPVEVLKKLRFSETETTKYYMEYLRLVQLPGLPLTHLGLCGQGIMNEWLMQTLFHLQIDILQFSHHLRHHPCIEHMHENNDLRYSPYKQ